jgi:hypothetical protein
MYHTGEGRGATAGGCMTSNQHACRGADRSRSASQARPFPRFADAMQIMYGADQTGPGC